MDVSFKQEKGKGFVATVPGKDAVMIDDHYADRAERFTPTELLLFAMGSCSSVDVLNILEKMKQLPENYECSVSGEKREEHPKILKWANIHYRAWGAIKPESMKKAINLSLTRYCNVSIMAIYGGVDVTFSYSINDKLVEDRLHPEKQG